MIADYVVIGGAARNRVLLLEADGTGQNFLIIMPAGSAKLMGHQQFDWRLKTEPAPSLRRAPARVALTPFNPEARITGARACSSPAKAMIAARHLFS